MKIINQSFHTTVRYLLIQSKPPISLRNGFQTYRTLSPRVLSHISYTATNTSTNISSTSFKFPDIYPPIYESIYITQLRFPTEKKLKYIMGAFLPTALFASLLLLFTNPASSLSQIHSRLLPAPLILPQGDVDLLEFPLNLEYLEADFFLWGALGYGLDKVAPELVDGGPEQVGGKMADLCPFVRDIITQFAYQEVGHIRLDCGLPNGFLFGFFFFKHACCTLEMKTL